MLYLYGYKRMNLKRQVAYCERFEAEPETPDVKRARGAVITRPLRRTSAQRDGNELVGSACSRRIRVCVGHPATRLCQVTVGHPTARLCQLILGRPATSPFCSIEGTADIIVLVQRALAAYAQFHRPYLSEPASCYLSSPCIVLLWRCHGWDSIDGRS